MYFARAAASAGVANTSTAPPRSTSPSFVPSTSAVLIRLSVNVTFDVYWLGRPRRWLGSLAAVTVPESFASWTLAEICVSALVAVRGWLPVALAFPASSLAFGLVLLHAVSPAQRMSAAAVVVRVLFMAVMVAALVCGWWRCDGVVTKRSGMSGHARGPSPGVGAGLRRAAGSGVGDVVAGDGLEVPPASALPLHDAGGVCAAADRKSVV